MLEVAGVSKLYARRAVVREVSLTVAPGECLGVIGPNGAGKTTLFNLLDGTARLDGGAILLDGNDIGRLPQHRRAQAGIGRAYQVPRPFSGLSVHENVLAGVMHGPRLHGAAARARVAEILETVGLSDRRATLAGALPLMDRKRLELARAISVGSRVLLLDEIAGGLTEGEVLQLIEVVKRLKPGRAVLWIEHIAHALMAAADRLAVLHFGELVAEGAPEPVMHSALVQEIYLGIAVDDALDG
jgi:branched-chain amino acid transport system ATP-binding protein